MIALAGGAMTVTPRATASWDGESAYPAGRRVDEKGLAGFETELLQHGVRGPAGSRERSCYLPRNIVGFADQARWLGECVFLRMNGVTELPKTSSPQRIR